MRKPKINKWAVDSMPPHLDSIRWIPLLFVYFRQQRIDLSHVRREVEGEQGTTRREDLVYS
jgi:hypothetical protein